MQFFIKIIFRKCKIISKQITNQRKSVPMPVKERIKDVRKILTNNRKEFASLIKRSDRTVENWEKGETVPNLNDLARILDIDKNINMNWLICGHGEMFSHQTQHNVMDNQHMYTPTDLKDILDMLRKLDARLTKIEEKDKKPPD